jgi:hypothetical protein
LLDSYDTVLNTFNCSIALISELIDNAHNNPSIGKDKTYEDGLTDAHNLLVDRYNRLREVTVEMSERYLKKDNEEEAKDE